MICRLCSLETNNCFHFFEAEGRSLNAVTIIRKHFWFEPRENDIESLYICRNCWSIVDSFHSLYITVENSQKELESISNFKSIIQGNDFGLKCEVIEMNESLNSEEKIDKDSLSNPDFRQDMLNGSVQDSLKCESYDNINEKIERTTVELKLIPNEKNVFEELKFGSKLKSKRKCGKQLLKETKSINSEILRQKKSGEVVSDEEIFKMKRITCHICTIEIPTFLELRKHFAAVHNEEGYAICCEKKFYKRYKFVHHLKMHCYPHEFRCPHCDKQLGSKKYVTLHIKNKHTLAEKVRKYSCEICGKSFAQKGILVRHMLTHVPENEKQFLCDQCEKTFPTQGVLRTHKITVHEGRYGGICALCGKKYQNPQDLKRHCLEHEGISEPKAQCEVCGDWLANKYKLKRHMIKHNTAHLEHRCPHCNKSSPNEIALKSHIKFAHNESNKIHKCSVCEKAFRRRIDLKEHMTVHTGEHLYTCPHCPRTFTHHSNVHHHRKKMHRKEFDEERAKRKSNMASRAKKFSLQKEHEALG